MKGKIKEIESLLATWVALRDGAKSKGIHELTGKYETAIVALKSAISILKEPSNTQMHTGQTACERCLESYQKHPGALYCGFCGRPLGQ